MLRIGTAIISESPLADEARAWDEVLADALLVEARLGWRYLWEAPVFRERAERARLAAVAAHAQASAWVPADETEASNRANLLVDLAAYKAAFAAICAAIDSWPALPSGAPDPVLADVVAAAVAQ